MQRDGASVTSGIPMRDSTILMYDAAVFFSSYWEGSPCASIPRK